MVITIIGSGMMGSALAFPARENGNEVRLCGTHLDKDIISECKKVGKHPKFDRPFPNGVKYYYYEEMEDAVKDADFIIGGVNSFGVDWFLEQVLLKTDEKIPVITVTKGLICLDDGKLISYPEYWENKLAEKGITRDLMAIGGPCTSYELVFHDKTEVAFCGKNADLLRKIKAALETDYYNISLSLHVKTTKRLPAT